MNKIKIYGEIGYMATAEKLQADLALANGEPIEVEIFSEGGSYFEGLMMYKMLKEYAGEKRFRVVGLSASMATYIMLAGGEIIADSNSYIMIHNPISGGYGDYQEMESKAELLKNLAEDMLDAYSAKCGEKLGRDSIKSMMDKETWMSAKQALEYGFIDGINEVAEAKLVAKLNAKYLVNAPNAVKAITITKHKEQMKDQLIKALGLEVDSEEKAITARVTDTVAKVNALTEELSAKAEIITGLNAKLEEAEGQLTELKAEQEAVKAEKQTDDLIAESGLLVSDEVKAKLQSRVNNYLKASADDKADRLEDCKLFIKAYGVKNTKVADEPTSRKDFSASNSVGSEMELVVAVNKLMEENPNMDYPTAVSKAKQQINGGK